MAASLIIVLVLCPLLSVSADPQQQQITARPGDDVTLLCQAPNNVPIATVEWSRPDLKTCIYMKRDGHVVTAVQDPSYRNRVQLKGEMKNGDLSLVLKKVTSNDGGTYECRYVEERGRRRKRADARKPIRMVHLKVEGPGGGHPGFIVSGTLFAVAVAGLAVAGFVISKKLRGRPENNPDLPGDDPDVHQQLQVNENSQKSITHNTSYTQV